MPYQTKQSAFLRVLEYCVWKPLLHVECRHRFFGQRIQGCRVEEGNRLDEVDSPVIEREARRARTLALLLAADIGLGERLDRDGSALGVIEKSLEHGGLKCVVVSLPKVKASEGPIMLYHIMPSHVVQVKFAIGSTDGAKSASESGCQGAAHVKARHQRSFDLRYANVLSISGSDIRVVRRVTIELGEDDQRTSILGLLARSIQDKGLDCQCSLEHIHGPLAGFFQSLAFVLATRN